MRFSSYINNQRCLEWGLNANQGALFDLLNQSGAWAQEVVVDGYVYYWVSRNEVIKELPLFYSKPDTVYRHFKDLSEKELIIYKKYGDKDLIRLTEKGKTWNEFNSDFNPNNSEIDPNKVYQFGNKSEKTRISIRKSSEIDPTNNNTNNKNTKDHINNTCGTEKPKKSSAFNPETVNLPQYVDRKTWIAYCKMRKAKRSEIKTEETLDKCLRDLAKFSGEDPQKAIAVLEQSIGNTWTGLFELNQPMNKHQTQKPDVHSGFNNRDYGEQIIPDWAKESAA